MIQLIAHSIPVIFSLSVYAYMITWHIWHPTQTANCAIHSISSIKILYSWHHLSPMWLNSSNRQCCKSQVQCCGTVWKNLPIFSPAQPNSSDRPNPKHVRQKPNRTEGSAEPNIRQKLGPFTEHVRPFWPNFQSFLWRYNMGLGMSGGWGSGRDDDEFLKQIFWK